MGPKIAAVSLVSLLASLVLIPGHPVVARAQTTPPAAAFPEPSPAPPTAGSPASPAPATASSPADAPVPPAAAPRAPPPQPAPFPPPYPWPYPPPPPGYAYGYYWPPPPPPPPQPRYPDDSAVSSSPFFDAILVAADWQHRFSEGVAVGAQAGLYAMKRVRLTAKIAFPTESVGDQQADFDSGTKNPSFFYAFTAGYALARTPTFAMSPGVLFARTDVSEYGTMLGLVVPFDWVMKSGLRLGLEGGLGEAFGGRRSVSCTTPGAADCNRGSRYEDRDTGLAVWIQFQIGFGFNHPEPLPLNAPPPAPAAPPR